MPVDDDMLREILIRLPPEPSSLPRASAVCKHWLGLVTDPKFHRQFYAHHRKPPLLGAFSWSSDEGVIFNPILDPPDRIPHARLTVARSTSNTVLDCRHGLVLLGDSWWKNMVLVCDPITGEQRSVTIPMELFDFYRNGGGTVLCADDNHGHAHGGCQSSPFKVVLFSMTRSETRIRVYYSETGGWGDLISTAGPYELCGLSARMSTLVGNTLYWLSRGNQILEFDLDGHGLSVIMGPPVPNGLCFRQIIQAEDGAIGFAIISYPHLQVWQKNVNGLGNATWVPWKTIDMDSIVGLPPRIEGKMRFIDGYDEDVDAIFLHADGSVYMVQLKSMQFQKLSGTFYGSSHPFRSFYTPAIRECDEANMLHDP